MRFRIKKESIAVKIETLDDLWYLRDVLEEGDEVIGVDYRRIRDDTKLRADRGERVKVKLKIELEKAEMSKSKSSLRLLGKIKEASREEVSLDSYHSFDLKKGDEVEIIKKQGFKAWQIALLEEAAKSSRAAKILFIAIEDTEAEFAILRAYGIDYILRASKSFGSKHVDPGKYEKNFASFISELSEKAIEICMREEIKNIIILGPGFAKEKLAEELGKRIREKALDIALHVESAGCGGRAGINEILKKGIAEKIAESSRIAYETRVVEEILKEISRGSGRAAYGIEEVEKAINFGAAEKVLILDSFLRESEKGDEIVKKAREIKAEVLIISSLHEAGEKLKAIGKIASLLRYAI